MGYRSQVKCLIYGDKDVVTGMLALDKLAPDNKNIDKVWGSCMSIGTLEMKWPNTQDKESSTLWTKITFDAEDVKWYETYDDVILWMDFMAKAEELELGVEFIRIGEEPDDIEHTESPESNNYLRSWTDIEDDSPTCTEDKFEYEVQSKIKELIS